MNTSPGPSARVLVTGGHGFVGARLLAALRRRRPDWTVHAPPGVPAGPGSLDVLDAEAVAASVKAAQPDMVVHLAAVAAVTAAVSDPRQAWAVNLGGTLNLVMALSEHAPRARLLFVSSAEVYGVGSPSGGATDEAALLAPVNPYAASKAAADILVRQSMATGLAATVMRPFNHTGAGQSEAFVVPSFAAQIARIEAGLQPPELHVGSLDDERDFLDVEDVVEAYILALEQPQHAAQQVFNVASGRAVRIGDVLEMLLSRSQAAIQVKVDEARLRKATSRRVVGDAGRLRATLGWSPRTPLGDTLQAVLDEQRARTGRSGAT